MKAGPISNVVCPGCKRSLDDVIESLIRQRGKFKGQREALRRERDAARVENERFRALTERACVLVGFAVDVPGRELEAQQWLDDAMAAFAKEMP